MRHLYDFFGCKFIQKSVDFSKKYFMFSQNIIIGYALLTMTFLVQV